MLKGILTIIRPLQIEDLATLYQWYNDLEYTYWLNGNWPERLLLRREDIERELYEEDPNRYAILDQTGRLIGTIGFDSLNLPARSVRLYIGIGEKSLWNGGYGADALKIFCDHLFRHWNFHRLTLETWAGNQRALACYAKAGFRQEGVLREAYYVDGTYRDGIMLARLRTDDWDGA
jgi:RimJ/RimL family protein N-acetyltransferase